eukprot:GEMP01030683.1.p1 GENE.GEMP01030683.1~~GEMP01030683.1.p1  ORF type:complete len:451 (+),score=87.79 GEMP01030683.1:111-1463(+)
MLQRARILKALPSQPPTNVTRLRNGMRAASQMTHDDTITVGVWIDAGSRYEARESNGAAHFLEHMAFKGTKRRTRIGLETEIENMGGHLNAYTSREQTVYHAKVFKGDLRQGVDILSDILLNSSLDNRNIEVERGVILREMEEVEKSTEEVIFDRLHLTAFRDAPLGFTILGPVENIRNLQRRHLLDYIEANYSADRMVVAAAGPVDHAELVRCTEELFAHCRPPSRPLVTEKPKFCEAELLYNNNGPDGLAHFAIAFEGVSWVSPDAMTFMVMQSVLGAYSRDAAQILPPVYSSNRALRNIALLNGDSLCKQFSSFNSCYNDTGMWGFYAATEPSFAAECAQELMWGIKALEMVTEDEVERGKRDLRTLLYGALDSTTAIAEDIGRQLLVYKRRIPFEEINERLDSIDANVVRDCARRYFRNTPMAVTALGPISNLPSLTSLKKITEMS